ncbi:glutaredoxin 3 [Sulfidibacter corallicola]|uniref:Glutaredoxin n=1 Tax=Sulfidibacter corallicola TaxID=2818388 RepID=A0A8A4TI86_SULCO|nr:glutaredoxin 3 [Sulfidibacter corallicola]QTD49207.1 glutaredoxin 3 [Sulfidibacter corallicola]
MSDSQNYQAEVVIYTTPWCPYCIRAKHLLNKKGVAFRDVNVSFDREMRQKLVQMSGGRTTVPQIFINGQSIGGSDELHGLEHQGELDAMLAAAPA